jgi:hypothetical protein
MLKRLSKSSYSIGIPIRISESLRKTPSYPRYLPINVVVSSDAVDKARDKETWSFSSNVKFGIREVSLHIDRQEPCSYYSCPQIVIVVGSLYAS